MTPSSAMFGRRWRSRRSCMSRRTRSRWCWTSRMPRRAKTPRTTRWRGCSLWGMTRSVWTSLTGPRLLRWSTTRSGPMCRSCSLTGSRWRRICAGGKSSTMWERTRRSRLSSRGRSWWTAIRRIRPASIWTGMARWITYSLKGRPATRIPWSGLNGPSRP